MKDPRLFNSITSCEILEILSIGGYCFSFLSHNYNLGKSKKTLKCLNVMRIIFSKVEDFYVFFSSSQARKA
jgi:hypothetical protein